MTKNKLIAEFELRQEPDKVLMCAPDFFQVKEIQNPHMKHQQGKVDRVLAAKQWSDLYKLLDQLTAGVSLVEPVEDCEDMVFTANQVFPFVSPSGDKKFIPSIMKFSSRQREVQYIQSFFENLNYQAVPLKSADCFESQGDLLWHPQRRLLWGGYGHRTSKNVYEEISHIVEAPVQQLKLIDDRFYHLDTCFCPLSQDSVLICPEAFDDNGKELIKSCFNDVIEVPLKEALNGFVCNGLAIDEKYFIVQKGSSFTKEQVAKLGFKIYELEASEFIKSGGSIFCMKMMFY